MGEEKSWQTWKARWKFTEENAISIVKEIFRLRGVQPVQKRRIEKLVVLLGDLTASDRQQLFLKDGLDFAIELGWLKDCFNETYKITSVGLMMLSHRIKG